MFFINCLEVWLLFVLSLQYVTYYYFYLFLQECYKQLFPNRNVLLLLFIYFYRKCFPRTVTWSGVLKPEVESESLQQYMFQVSLLNLAFNIVLRSYYITIFRPCTVYIPLRIMNINALLSVMTRPRPFSFSFSALGLLLRDTTFS